MRFKLAIQAGNDALRTTDQLAHLLRSTADALMRRLGDASLEDGDLAEQSGAILDMNGNRVGEWSFDDDA